MQQFIIGGNQDFSRFRFCRLEYKKFRERQWAMSALLIKLRGSMPTLLLRNFHFHDNLHQLFPSARRWHRKEHEHWGVLGFLWPCLAPDLSISFKFHQVKCKMEDSLAEKANQTEFRLGFARAITPTFHRFLTLQLILELLLLGLDMTLYHREIAHTTYSYLFHVLFNIPLLLVFNYITTPSNRDTLFHPNSDNLIAIFNSLYILSHAVYIWPQISIFPLYSYVFYAAPILSLNFISDWRYPPMLALLSFISITAFQPLPQLTALPTSLLIITVCLGYLASLIEAIRRKDHESQLEAR